MIISDGHFFNNFSFDEFIILITNKNSRVNHFVMIPDGKNFSFFNKAVIVLVYQACQSVGNKFIFCLVFRPERLKID